MDESICLNSKAPLPSNCNTYYKIRLKKKNCNTKISITRSNTQYKVRTDHINIQLHKTKWLVTSGVMSDNIFYYTHHTVMEKVAKLIYYVEYMRSCSIFIKNATK